MDYQSYKLEDFMSRHTFKDNISYFNVEKPTNILSVNNYVTKRNCKFFYNTTNNQLTVFDDVMYIDVICIDDIRIIRKMKMDKIINKKK